MKAADSRFAGRGLDRAGVPHDSYHLFGAHLNDAVVIDHRSRGWVVFYSERGTESDLRPHHSEDAACRDLLARLRRILDVSLLSLLLPGWRPVAFKIV